MNEEFEKTLITLAKKIDVNINKNQIKKYYSFMNLLLEWNEKVNLTAITEQKDIILKHFIDSLTVLKYIDNNKKIVDVGTGAGFPGIPIAIQKEDIQITLLDSLNKRINFLNIVKQELNIDNIKNIHGRAEEFGQNIINREKYDISISRAVANMSTLSEYLLPLVKIGGKAIFMKGSDIKQELKDSEFAIQELGGKIAKIENFLLPDTDMERNIIIVEKIKETPKRYPRKAGMPTKEPLKNK